MQRIVIDHEFAQPIDRIYPYLAEHENLAPVLGVSVRRVRDGDSSRNGAGSARSLKIGPLPAFEETVTRTVPGERIEYRITRGSPLRHHRGVMSFAPLAGGSSLHWEIEFGAGVPGLDRLVKVLLERSIRQGLSQVDALA